MSFGELFTILFMTFSILAVLYVAVCRRLPCWKLRGRSERRADSSEETRGTAGHSTQSTNVASDSVEPLVPLNRDSIWTVNGSAFNSAYPCGQLMQMDAVTAPASSVSELNLATNLPCTLPSYESITETDYRSMPDLPSYEEAMGYNLQQS